MDFEKFIKAASDPTLKAKAIAGFAERQAARDVRFEQQHQSRKPKPAWYHRRYDI